MLAAAAAVSLCLRAASAAVRHAVWMAAFCSLAALPLLAWITPAWPAGFVIPVASTVPAAGTAAAGLNASAIAVLAWGSVALILLIRLGLAHAGLARIVCRSRPVGSEKGVPVLETTDFTSPIAWGLWRPLILMPASAAQWPSGLRRNAITHELAHVARGDCFALLATDLVCCFYWFQPLAWWARGRSIEERERACDDAVLACGARGPDYADQLIAVARASLGTPAAGIAMVRKGELGKRIRAILDPGVSRRAVSRRATLITVSLFLLLVAPLAALRGQNEEIHKVGGDVAPPKLIHKVEPQYTQEAKDAGIEGKVVLSIEVTAKGEPRNVRVLEGLDPGLDINAVAAIAQWRFEPATRQGKTVAVRATVEVNFRLD